MTHRTLSLFSTRAIEAARPGTTLTEAGSRGLRLKVGKTGARSWIYRFNGEGGRLRQTTLGAYPAMGIGEAREAWAKLRGAKKSGGDPQTLVLKEKRARETASLSVAALVDDYLREHIDLNRAAKGRAETRRLFNRYVLAADGIGGEGAFTFTMAQASQFLTRVRLKSLASARVLRAELRAAWRHALEAGKVQGANPFADILKRKLPQLRRARYLDENEARTFLTWLPDSPMSQDARDALELTLRMGFRSGEAVALPWSALDLRAGTFTLHNTKGDAPRTVRLPRQVLVILKRRRASVPVGEAWVFPSPVEGKHIAQKALGVAIWVARQGDTYPFKGEQEQKRPWSAHDLRRTARTYFARLGIPREVAEAALGHTKGGIEGVYDLHEYEAEVAKALQILNDHLDALASTRKVAKLK